MMKKMIFRFACACVILASGLGAAPASAQTVEVEQQRAFGTLARGSTVCVGPISRQGGAGVQLFGFTNGNARLRWQLRTVSSQQAPTVIFETVSRNVDFVDTTTGGNVLFDACVVKTANAAQDFDILINSPPVE